MEPSDSKGWLALGVKTFQNGRFAEAVRPLQMAMALDPNRGTAFLLLSHRFLQLHYPPARTPLDVTAIRTARTNVEKALSEEPGNAGAMHALAFLSRNEQSFPDTQSWYEKLVTMDTQDAAALYGLADVMLAPWWPDYEQALTTLGMSHEDPGGHTGPFRDPVRTELQKKHWTAIARGLENAGKALQINPRFDDAMGIMSALLRARAYLQPTVEEFRHDRQTAHEWLMKSLQTRQRNRTP